MNAWPWATMLRCDLGSPSGTEYCWTNKAIWLVCTAALHHLKKEVSMRSGLRQFWRYKQFAWASGPGAPAMLYCSFLSIWTYLISWSILWTMSLEGENQACLLTALHDNTQMTTTLQPQSAVGMKDSGEGKPFQWQKWETGYLVVHFAWKERWQRCFSILTHGQCLVVWLDIQGFGVND